MPWVNNQRGNANGAQAWEAALPNEGWKFKAMNKFGDVWSPSKLLSTLGTLNIIMILER